MALGSNDLVKYFGLRNESSPFFDENNQNIFDYSEIDARLIDEIFLLFDGSRPGAAFVRDIDARTQELFIKTITDPDVREEYKNIAQRSISFCYQGSEPNPKISNPEEPAIENSSYPFSCPAVPSGFLGKEYGESGRANKQNTSIAAIQVFPSHLQHGGTDAGRLQLFFNALPTIEMSRCTPYLDIKVITNNSFTVAGGDGPYGLTQFNFLSQNQQLGDSDKIILRSQPEENLPDNVTLAGMELFTSPQTLVNADEDYFEPAGAETTGREQHATPVIDKFRPFVTIQEFNVNVVPAFGITGYRTADLKLVLHDKSRLASLGPLVQPQIFGQIEILVEWGWSHPGAENDEDNPIAKFINDLRKKTKFKVVNSSFTFDDKGQVHIKVELAELGGIELSAVTIALGAGVLSAYEKIEEIKNQISQLSDKISKNSTYTDILGKTITSSLSSTTRAMTVNPEFVQEIKGIIEKNKDSEIDTIKELTSVLLELYGDGEQVGRIVTADENLSTALDEQAKLLSEGPDPFASPFPMPKSQSNTEGVGGPGVVPSINVPSPGKWESGDYVSLGKLLMIYVGKSYANLAKYDEVQFIFYGFNQYATFFRNHNISQFPINVSEFKDALKARVGEDVDMTLAQFMDLINEEFMQNKLYSLWGFNAYSGLYENKLDEETGKYKKELRQGVTADQVATANNNDAQVIKAAYPEGASSIYKAPRLAVRLDAQPGFETDADGNLVENSELTILRIYVTDDVASATEPNEMLLSFLGNDSLDPGDASILVGIDAWSQQYGNQAFSTLHDTKIAAKFSDAKAQGVIGERSVSIEYIKGLGLENVDITKLPNNFTYRYVDGTQGKLKEYLRKSGPSILVGSEYSPIQAANLSSIHDPTLNTIKQKEYANDVAAEVVGVGDYGIPIQVIPTTTKVDMLGNPLVRYGQKLFIDFNSSTTADSYYFIVGLNHKITEKSFQTSLDMMQNSTFESFRSPRTIIKNAIEKSLPILQGDNPGVSPVWVEIGGDGNKKASDSPADTGSSEQTVTTKPKTTVVVVFASDYTNATGPLFPWYDAFNNTSDDNKRKEILKGLKGCVKSNEIEVEQSELNSSEDYIQTAAGWRKFDKKYATGDTSPPATGILSIRNDFATQFEF